MNKIELKYYIVLAMARSGHHALINWMGCQFPGEFIHYNNGVKGWEENKFKPYRKKRQMFNMNDMTGVQGRLINIEDFDMDDWTKYNMDSFDCFKYCTVYPIIFIRDPWNWAASCIKAGNPLNKLIGKDYMGRHHNASRADLQKKQMKECLGQTNILKDKIIINYNEWFTSKDYRKKTAEKLDIPFTDAGINDVTGFGGGSSFDKLNSHGKAQDMNVLKRWKNFRSDPRFVKCMDKEMKILSRELFGEEY